MSFAEAVASLDEDETITRAESALLLSSLATLASVILTVIIF